MAEMKRLMIELEEAKEEIQAVLTSVKEKGEGVYRLLFNNGITDEAKSECLKAFTDNHRLIDLIVLRIKLDEQTKAQR